MHRRSAAWMIVLLPALLGGSAARGMERPSLDGYCKDFFVVYDMPPRDIFGLPSPAQLLGRTSIRLRLNAAWRPAGTVSVRISYAAVPVVQAEALFDEDLFGYGIDPFRYRIGDLDRMPYPDDTGGRGGVAYYQNLDRLFAEISLPWADVLLGPQPVAWGSARAVNPTDVIAPFAYTELDTEERIGVDAARVRVPVGAMGEIDAGWVAGRDLKWENSAAFLRVRQNAARIDATVMAVAFREHLMIGCDLARSIGGAGAWLEAAYVDVGALSDGRKSGSDYLRLSTGLDYSLSDGLYGFIEYHFNGAGASEAGEYAGLADTPAYVDGAVYLLGRQYAVPGISYALTPLLTLAGEMLVNLDDPSVLLAPSADYSVAEDVYVSAGAYVGIGKRPGLEGGGSEFGSYPGTWFTSFRIYF